MGIKTPFVIVKLVDDLVEAGTVQDESCQNEWEEFPAQGEMDIG